MKHFENRTDPNTGERYLQVNKNGVALFSDPLLNKGTAFTLEEREKFGLGGILPPAVSTWFPRPCPPGRSNRSAPTRAT
ncbi:MAG: hypothetical protein ACYS0E_20755 [Planctomycetota bacterium]|jgi:hypothetical protein